MNRASKSTGDELQELSEILKLPETQRKLAIAGWCAMRREEAAEAADRYVRELMGGEL